MDGVYAGYLDSTLPYYYELCRKANLPCYLNKQILECCTNKRKFKNVCERVGIETIPDIDIADLKKVEYPILIKPVDNSGSKGITVCYNEEMVPSAYEKACKFSKSKQVITEKFMTSDYVCAYYGVGEGKAELF